MWGGGAVSTPLEEGGMRNLQPLRKILDTPKRDGIFSPRMAAESTPRGCERASGGKLFSPSQN